MSRVLRALKKGGSVTSIAREAKVDPVLVELAADHERRLKEGCATGCPASRDEAPAGCRSCPLLPLAPTW